MLGYARMAPATAARSQFHLGIKWIPESRHGFPPRCRRRFCTMHTSATACAIARDDKPIFAGKSDWIVARRNVYVIVMAAFSAHVNGAARTEFARSMPEPSAIIALVITKSVSMKYPVVPFRL
jgi:hypothetical protein